MSLRPKDTLITALILCLTFQSYALVMADTVHDVFSEGTGAELVTVVLFAFAFGLWWTTSPSRRAGWHIGMVIILMMMRELDFDKRFTADGVLQLRLYSSADNPVYQKVIGFMVIALIAVVVIRICVRDVPGLLRGLRANTMAAWLMGIAFVVLCLSKTLDGLARKLAPWGIYVSEWANTRAGRIEELAEMVFAILLVQVLVYCEIRRREHRAQTHGWQIFEAGYHPLNVPRVR
ncbi:hypothetical protein ERN12_08915 [Rhodobacteraceae bacterium]|nr:hypothetical protein ERN12_08915 [Paracoccaceae bacterium]